MGRKRQLRVADMHTAGCPVRVLLSGLPPLAGRTIGEKMQDMQQNYDWVRRMLLWEPRGKECLVGAILTDPVTPDAAAGVFYLGQDFYGSFCGSGAMAVGKVLAESGTIPLSEPVTDLIVDTVNGHLHLFVQVQEGTVKSVSFQNQGVHARMTLQKAKIPGFGEVTYGLCSGGNYFALLFANAFGREITQENIPFFRTVGRKLLPWFAAEVPVVNPITGTPGEINEVMFCGERTDDSGKRIFTSAIVYGDGIVDRAPCGSGTCARMAWELARGNWAEKEFVHESIFGTRFTGRIERSWRQDGWQFADGVVTGMPYRIGQGLLIAEEGDPLWDGFQMD